MFRPKSILIGRKNYDGRMDIIRQGKYMAANKRYFEEKIFIGVCALLYHDVL